MYPPVPGPFPFSSVGDGGQANVGNHAIAKTTAAFSASRDGARIPFPDRQLPLSKA